MGFLGKNCVIPCFPNHSHMTIPFSTLLDGLSARKKERNIVSTLSRNTSTSSNTCKPPTKPSKQTDKARISDPPSHYNHCHKGNIDPCSPMGITLLFAKFTFIGNCPSRRNHSPFLPISLLNLLFTVEVRVIGS
jgi:hypothetical protein